MEVPFFVFLQYLQQHRQIRVLHKNTDPTEAMINSKNGPSPPSTSK